MHTEYNKGCVSSLGPKDTSLTLRVPTDQQVHGGRLCGPQVVTGRCGHLQQVNSMGILRSEGGYTFFLYYILSCMYFNVF